MPTTRDNIRANRAAVLSRARAKGINVDDILASARDGRAATYQIGQLVNGVAGVSGRYSLQFDDPPVGAFDNINRLFTLSAQVLGQNIGVIATIQATGTTTRLIRTTSNDPVAGTFYFDGDATIVIGRAPVAGDALIAAYITRR